MRVAGCLLLLTFTTGCTINQQVEGLEAHLRQREAEMNRLAGELERSQVDLAAAQQETQALRAQLASDGKPVIPAEQAALFYRLSGVQIDSLQSAFVPTGDQGDGEFTVFVTPVDQFQTALRIPGAITITVISMGSGEKKTLAQQTFTAEQVLPLWNAGWVSSGFVLQFSAQGVLSQISSKNTVQLEAEFVTADGRKFSDQQELAIHQAKRFPVKKSVSTEAAIPLVMPARFEEAAPLEERPAPPAIDTSDRRTIEEFPVYR